MSLPKVVAVAPGSPAARAGVRPGDEIRTVADRVPRDILQYRQLTDAADPALAVARPDGDVRVEIIKRPGEPLGIEVESAIFDQVRTCDNHCEFCFIHQLPAGLRPSLYVRDDDYRLSFLHGNFTTLTRFTEADLERVVTEALGPLYVSIHATDPEVRADMLRNRRGASSLRWLRALLDHGIMVHGQVVVCPGVNDGATLESTLCGVLESYPELASLAVVPLGVSAYNREPRMRPHTVTEATVVVDLVANWQEIFGEELGRRLVYAADEFYLRAGRPFPPAAEYGEFDMYEDGIGMARCLEEEFAGRRGGLTPTSGFFDWVDGAPAEGYRTPRVPGLRSPPAAVAGDAPVAVLSGELGAAVIGPLVARSGHPEARVITVENAFFGGNIGVTGLIVGADLSRVLADAPTGHRYLLPDVCLSGGRFLDGTTPAELPRPVEVIATDGHALREALAPGSR